MPKITITKPFTYSPDGLTTITLPPGEHELLQHWVNSAISSGCAKAKTAPKNKARKSAPLNKAAR